MTSSVSLWQWLLFHIAFKGHYFICNAWAPRQTKCLIFSLACLKTHHPFQSQEAKQTLWLMLCSQFPPTTWSLTCTFQISGELGFMSQWITPATDSFPSPIPKCKGHLCSIAIPKYNTTAKDSNHRIIKYRNLSVIFILDKKGWKTISGWLIPNNLSKS